MNAFTCGLKTTVKNRHAKIFCGDLDTPFLRFVWFQTIFRQTRESSLSS